MSTYKASDQMWLSDSLNWEKTSILVSSDWSLASFLFQSSFINQHLSVDHVSKLSHLDVTLIKANSNSTSIQTLYTSFMDDLILEIFTFSLPTINLLQTEYQEIFSTLILVAPELSLMLSDYVFAYYTNSVINYLPSAVFDSYTNNLNFYFSEGVLHFMMFWFFVWFVIYFFTTNLSLKWSLPAGSHFMRFYYYFFSISRETRIQFEAVMQSMLFFLFYWGMTLLTFDDDQDEIIEFVDSSFFYMFSIVVLYLIYKHSIHYFAFLEASVSEGRSVNFVTVQFVKDFLATFSLMLRFYILLFRMNVYDTLEDFFDSYYIFIGDFDDDEYLNELFLSIHGTILFTFDNHDDRSFLFEDENDFASDLFYSYYVIWGKFFYFLIYMLEEGARLGLALYITFLIIFEVHAANCSYREDTFLNIKKQKHNE